MSRIEEVNRLKEHRGGRMKTAFQQSAKVDAICRNCAHYDADMEIGSMYGICEYAKVRSGSTVIKEANQYCNEAK